MPRQELLPNCLPAETLTMVLEGLYHPLWCNQQRGRPLEYKVTGCLCPWRYLWSRELLLAALWWLLRVVLGVKAALLDLER